MFVSAAPNIRYLSGFTGSNALLLMTGDRAVLFTDPRYEIQAAEEADCQVRVERGPLLVALAKSLRRRKIRRIAVEPDHLSLGDYRLLKSQAPSGARILPLPGLIETLRMVKSAEEIELMRHSAAINSQAFADTVKQIKPGLRETQIAAELEYWMRRRGADKPAFETIVAAGSRSALPHAQPTGATLRKNQLLLIDMGAVSGGYASDMTRMAFLGRPGRKVTHLYKAVLHAQLVALEAVREGIRAGDIDRAARQVLRQAGLDALFGHSTGHGLGLEIHEPPRLGLRDATRLQEGMAITIEPGVYLQGFGGIRIEDTVIVTKDGCEVLTPTSKELLVL